MFSLGSYHFCGFSFLFQKAVLALDSLVLDIDQVENLIKFCPTKEEMEMLKVLLFPSCLSRNPKKECMNCNV